MTTCQTEEGCSLHAILPRTLARLSETNFKNDLADKKVSEILNALQEADVQQPSDSECKGPGSADQKDLTELLAQIQHEEEASFAKVNQKRRLLTFEAFRDKDLTSKTVALESLMKPNVHYMDVLFERTQCISDLSKLPPSQMEKQGRLRERFLRLAHQYIFQVLLRWFSCVASGQAFNSRSRAELFFV